MPSTFCSARRSIQQSVLLHTNTPHTVTSYGSHPIFEAQELTYSVVTRFCPQEETQRRHPLLRYPDYTQGYGTNPGQLDHLTNKFGGLARSADGEHRQGWADLHDSMRHPDDTPTKNSIPHPEQVSDSFPLWSARPLAAVLSHCSARTGQNH
ncbi:unnamed protein product, partial [Ectocarpus sp. 12 AP-2014]